MSADIEVKQKPQQKPRPKPRKKARQARRLRMARPSFRKLATETGLSKGFLCMIWSGKRRPGLVASAKIASALGIGLEDFARHYLKAS